MKGRAQNGRADGIVELARSMELFSGIDKATVERLVYGMNGVKKTYCRGETLVHAGLEATRMYAVVTGRLHVYEETSDDRQVLVREIGPGEVLGLWMQSVPDVNCWPGTVVAAEDSVVISLSMSAARELARKADADVARLAVNSMKILSREMFHAWRKLTVMNAQTIESRIKTYLRILDNESGRTGRVTVPFNRERMAEYFGVTRPALSRAIGQLRDRGLLAWRKNVFTIRF